MGSFFSHNMTTGRGDQSLHDNNTWQKKFTYYVRDQHRNKDRVDLYAYLSPSVVTVSPSQQPPEINLAMACMCNATRLTVFPSDAVRGFRLAMSRAFPVSADRTFVWASLHLVRGHRIWRPIAHLVVAVKACGLALWLRFMGLKRTVHSRIVEICSISHSGVLTSQSGDPLSWIRAFLFLLSFYWHF